MNHIFKPSEAHKLEDPARLRWLPPAEVIERLALTPGMEIADIGAGTGYFSIPIARAVTLQGKVFAIDLQPEMLDMLTNKLRHADAPSNICLKQGDAAHLPLPNTSVDLTFLANIWHEFDAPQAVVEAIKRV